MAIDKNVITTEETVKALDQEMAENFRGEYDRLAEIIGIFEVDKVTAGTALYQYSVTGQLADGKVDPSYTAASGDAPAVIELGSSSGSAYREGDFITRSKYVLQEHYIDRVKFKPYAKQTTADAIQKGGYVNAIMRSDRKAAQQMRAAVLSDFFAFLANGTGKAAPASGTWNLQQVLAYTAAALGDALESNDEEGGEIVHFVNRQDAAGYLASADITTQEAFGMTYLQSFLGVRNVLLTNKVAAGTVWATPVENIHVYGLDFAALDQAGLSYETDSMGLIGVAHKPDYDHGSVDTYLVRGANFVPEVKDFIVRGSMAPVVTTGESDGE